MRIFEHPTQLLIVVLVIVVIFGWKRLPDATRSLGRSMRIFKSEVDEMKNEGKSSPSAASGDTVKGETVDPTSDSKADPAARETQNQPPA